MYCNLGSRTTIDFIGTQHVPAISSGSESYRCTLALTISSERKMWPPHFVFKGEVGGAIEKEINGYATDDDATSLSKLTHGMISA